MRWILIALASLALVGCYDDQKRDLAQCKMAAQDAFGIEREQKVDLCMEARGYDRMGAAADKDCSTTLGEPSAQCFRPSNWLGRLTYRLDPN